MTGNDANTNMMNEELSLLSNVQQKIIDLFSDTHFINYTNSEFVEFKSINFNKFNSSYMEKLFKKTYDYRHMVAHNISSVYKDYLSICDIDDSHFTCINFYSRFMVLIFIDTIFINKFKEYQKKHTKIKWL